MATCDPATLLASGKCLSCLSSKELQAIIAQLLCEISSSTAPIVREAGVATLAGGTATVLSTHVTSTSTILLSHYNIGSPLGGTLRYSNVVDGVSFQINTGSALDTNKVSWAIIN